ncbi:MAG: hypothetical protein JWN70_2251 [Planctomycetaceae bacterium]|nr:hypothetical protein [Planctomycetaceae bacterium]
MNADALPSAQTRPTNVRWTVFSLTFATSALLYLHRYVFGFIKPTLATEWGLSNTELGAMDSAFSVFYTLPQFPIAIVADALGVHAVMTSLMIVWMSGLALMAWAPSAIWMWYAQALLGVGQSAVYACVSRIASTWFPPSIRTTLQGLVAILAGRLGALSSSLIFTTLLLGILELNWRTALWIQVAVGVALMLLFATLFRSSPRQHPRVNMAEVLIIEENVPSNANPRAPSSERLTVRKMLSTVSTRSFMNLMFLSVQSLLSTFADNIFSNWIPLFLAQVHHLKFKEMGIYAALPLLGGAIAGLVGGGLNDYLIAVTGNRRWSRVAVALTGKSIAAVLLLAALRSYDQPYVFCIYLFFVKLFSDCSLTTSWGVVTDIGGRATASVFALNNSIAGIGQIAAPIVFGYVSAQYGWHAVFVTVAVAYVLCAISWLFIDCTIPVLRETEEPGTV